MLTPFEGTPFEGLVEYMEVASELVLVGDLLATLAKAQRSGVGGPKQPNASGLNYLFRQIGKKLGKPELTRLLTGIGDRIAGPIALLGAFTGAYNATILAQCALGAIS